MPNTPATEPDAPASPLDTCCPPSDVPPPKVSLGGRLRFWRSEVPLRLRSWWHRHWWPARIRQLDRERADWKRWHGDANSQIGTLADFIMHEVPGEPSDSEGAVECAIRLLRVANDATSTVEAEHA